MRIPVLYQDDAIVVIAKPVGLPVHPAQAGDPRPAAALSIAQAQLSLPYLGTPQRLDAEASGVVVCTTRREGIDPLAKALAAPDCRQTYLALVQRAPDRREGSIDVPILRARDHYKVATPRDKRAQRNVTHYRVSETAPGGRYSLIEAATSGSAGEHQVRLHLAYLGTHVVGDVVYARGSLRPEQGGKGARDLGQARGPQGRRGASERVAGRGDQRGAQAPPAQASSEGGESRVGQAAAPRLGLHLYRVSFAHPTSGQMVTFEAPPPAFFARLASGLPELDLAARRRPIRRIRPGTPGTAELIDLAVSRRAPLHEDPATNIYRLINGAADGLPGLAVDRYGDALVANVYDEGDRPEPLASGWFESLVRATGASAVYVKYRQREAARVEEEALQELAPARPGLGSTPGEYPALEEGLRYLVRPGEGWNPGLFPDMREMRGRVRAWAPGKRVLNCFAYTCGFGVAALAGGAARVANLDVSSPALERGRANYRANGFVPDERDFLYGDAFDWLGRLAECGELFDIVILDPPGFARTRQHVWSAAQQYGRLAQLAAAVTAPAGLLIACCNVADLAWRSFEDRVMSGLDQAWRAAEIVGRYPAPGLDFPAEAGRESYLKVLVARLA